MLIVGDEKGLGPILSGQKIYDISHLGADLHFLHASRNPWGLIEQLEKSTLVRI